MKGPISMRGSMTEMKFMGKNLLKFTLTMVMAIGEKDLLKDVHVAFKETRSIGKNRIGIYQPNSPLEANQQRIQKFIHIINHAISENDIVPFFQPIMNNKTYFFIALSFKD